MLRHTYFHASTYLRRCFDISDLTAVVTFVAYMLQGCSKDFEDMVDDDAVIVSAICYAFGIVNVSVVMSQCARCNVRDVICSCVVVT